MAEIDHATLLSVVELHCAEACRVTQIGPETLVVKFEPARTYLTMTPAQWAALKAFDPGRSVPEVLVQLIMDRGCLPLRDFYELVIKAFECGILQTEGQSPQPPLTAYPWRWHVDGRWMRKVAAWVLVAALAAMVARPMQLPENFQQLFIGWMLTCVAISAGYFIAGCATRRAGAEVYHPEFCFGTLWPHFRVDLDDAIMAGTSAVVDASLMRIAPLFFVLVAAAFWHTGIVLPLVVAVMVLLSPFWPSPGLSTIQALYGTRRSDVTRNFRFGPNQGSRYALKTHWKNTDLRFVAIHAVFGLIWLVLVLLAGSLLVRADLRELWQACVAADAWRFSSLALLALVSVAMAGALGTLAWVGFEAARETWRETRPRKVRARPRSETPETVRALIDESELFGQLPEPNRAALVLELKREEFPAREMITQEGESGDKLYFLFSGRVELLREMKSGRRDRVAVLATGDIFGEGALMYARPRTRSTRTLETSVLLSLSREAFQLLVRAKLSRSQVEDAVQKVGFFRRISLARNWSARAITAFARHTTFRDFAQDECLIREGEDNHFFHVLFEGQLAMRKGRKEIAHLNVGDFFGEVSLLQNSVAVSSIYASTPGRCLVINKREFLLFLSRDFGVGLQFEAISSKRLRRPIFPLQGKSFDAAHR